MVPSSRPRSIPAAVALGSALLVASALGASPADAATVKPVVPSVAAYTLVLTSTEQAGCGPTSVDGSYLTLRAGVAHLAMPGRSALVGVVTRHGTAFAVHVRSTSGAKTGVDLTGTIGANHQLKGTVAYGGVFPGADTGYSCNTTFTSLVVPAAKTPCPTSAAVYAAWRKKVPVAGPAVTGFGPVTCWRTWAVAHVRGRSDGNVVFARSPKLHVNTPAEGAAFHQQVCGTPTAPKAWRGPTITLCAQG
ncbi:hypothetical protein acdb102_04680 [Acidothermaceae bacterium B102]|nr:hypothetical protein acdb102_04680 [Acidothermaceae bacterium B102]